MYQVLDKNKTKPDEIIAFLNSINDDFPVPLNRVTDIIDYANKLLKFGDLFFIKNDSHIIGIIGGYNNDVENRIGYISILFVLSNYRGKGIGTTLLETFIETSIKQGMNLIHVNTNRKNEEAIRLYKGKGFVLRESGNVSEYTLIRQL